MEAERRGDPPSRSRQAAGPLAVRARGPEPEAGGGPLEVVKRRSLREQARRLGAQLGALTRRVAREEPSLRPALEAAARALRLLSDPAREGAEETSSRWPPGDENR